jgi:hypothetical protein
VVLNEVGQDPGIDQAYAVRTFGEVLGREGRCVHKIPSILPPSFYFHLYDVNANYSFACA